MRVIGMIQHGRRQYWLQLLQVSLDFPYAIPSSMMLIEDALIFFSLFLSFCRNNEEGMHQTCTVRVARSSSSL